MSARPSSTALAGLDGIYVPDRYDVRYAADGTLADVTPRRAARPPS